MKNSSNILTDRKPQNQENNGNLATSTTGMVQHSKYTNTEQIQETSKSPNHRYQLVKTSRVGCTHKTKNWKNMSTTPISQNSENKINLVTKNKEITLNEVTRAVE